MGKKDIMKIECPIDFMDLDILGFIDHNITVNIIENEQIVAKKQLTLPKEIRNVIRCKNPRCIHFLFIITLILHLFFLLYAKLNRLAFYQHSSAIL